VWQSEGHRMWYIDQLRSEGVHTLGASPEQNADTSEGLNNTKSEEL